MFMVGLAAAAITMSVLSGASQARSQAQAQKFQNQMAAMKARSEARIADINAATSAHDTVMNQISLQQQVMSQALQDGAAMATTKISHAGSGVAMDSASKYEERGNQKLMHVIGMANAEANRVQALNNDNMKTMQYRANAIVNRAGAAANSILADAQHPNRVFAQSLITGGLVGATQFAQATNMFGQVEASSFGGSNPNGKAAGFGVDTGSGYNLGGGPVQSNYGISMGGIPNMLKF